jgi:hypothetical protein
MDDHKSVERDEPFMMRLFDRLSDEPPDPLMRERLRRNLERHAAVQKIYDVVWLIAAVVFCVLAFIWLSFL